MPTVADYAVLRDSSVELSAGESFETSPFFRPRNFVAGTSRAKAILAFKAVPLPRSTPTATFAPSVDLRVSRLSAPVQDIYNLHLETETVHGLWETFAATGFGENVGTVFQFSVSRGRVRIADVILWYQVSVPSL
jgi:hypothetical protein